MLMASLMQRFVYISDMEVKESLVFYVICALFSSFKKSGDNAVKSTSFILFITNNWGFF